MSHLKTIIFDAWNYFYVALISVKPIWAVIVSTFAFVMFPHSAMLMPAATLSCMVLVDILTKFYSISKSQGGWLKAFRLGKWNSNRFFVGARKKLIDIGVLFVVCGLTVRFSNSFELAGLAFTTFAYSVMMLREIMSVFENMIEAGHDGFRVYLGWIKKKSADLEMDSGKSESPTRHEERV